MRAPLLSFALFGFVHLTPQVALADQVVIELYTSQGCSSCPPADKILHDLAQRDDVIALSLHVDYWDYIGWTDVFGRAENTARQQAYARAAAATTVYTPQMIIDGVDHVIGSRPMQVMDLVQKHRAEQNPVTVDLVRSGDDLQISAVSTYPGDYMVEMIRYIPEATVDVGRGENAGMSLTYTNIVSSLEQIATWDGVNALNLSVPAAGSEPVVILVQMIGHGPIVGVARLR